MLATTPTATQMPYPVDLKEKIFYLKIKRTALEALYILEKFFSVICYASPLSCVFVKKIPFISKLARKMWILGIAILVLEKIGAYITRELLPPLNRKIALNNRLLSQLENIQSAVNSSIVDEPCLYEKIEINNLERAKNSFSQLQKKLKLLNPLEPSFNSYFEQFDAQRATEKEIYKHEIEHFLPELLLACGYYHPLSPEKCYQKIPESMYKNLDSNIFLDGFYVLEISFKRHQQLDENHPLFIEKMNNKLRTFTYKEFSSLCKKSKNWEEFFSKFPFRKRDL